MIRSAMRTAVATLLGAAVLSTMLAAAQQPPPQTPPAATTAAKPQQPPAQPQQPPAQPPAAATAAKPPAPRAAPAQVAGPARVSATVFVTDLSGNGLPDVHVMLTGPVSREGTTGRDGTLRLQGLKSGDYRLRFQAPEFLTLETLVTLKPGSTAEVDVSLNRDLQKPKSPEPEPVPAPVSAPAARPAAPPDPSATVELLALPDWVERNLIGRSDPLKESTVGKTSVETASVIQVREPLKDRVRNDADEMLYVIAGEGVLRSKGRELSLDAGALVVVPRGVGYSIERKGRNPLIALSIVGR
jgi:mannose-6-phosphate isomerase-like protein (cupin superfamily)